MYNKRIRVKHRKDEPLTPKRVKKIRAQGIKDYQSQLVVVKEDIAKALKEKEEVFKAIAAEEERFSSWVRDTERDLDIKRAEATDFVTQTRASLNTDIQEARSENIKNEKTLARIKAVEVKTAYDLRKIEVSKKDAEALIIQSKISEERVVAKTENLRRLIKQNEDLSIKVNREWEALQETKEALESLNNRYDQRIETFEQLRKEVVSKENEVALIELSITEKLNKIEEIAKAEGNDL